MIVKSAKLRWSAAMTKRGDRCPVTRSDVEIPRITTTVRQTRVMTPAPRVANQSGLGPEVVAAIIEPDPAS
jgi:hypothetical protein